MEHEIIPALIRAFTCRASEMLESRKQINTGNCGWCKVFLIVEEYEQE